MMVLLISKDLQSYFRRSKLRKRRHYASKLNVSWYTAHQLMVNLAARNLGTLFPWNSFVFLVHFCSF
jgi:hypothetical protein